MQNTHIYIYSILKSLSSRVVMVFIYVCVTCTYYYVYVCMCVCVQQKPAIIAIIIVRVLYIGVHYLYTYYNVCKKSDLSHTVTHTLTMHANKYVYKCTHAVRNELSETPVKSKKKNKE